MDGRRIEDLLSEIESATRAIDLHQSQSADSTSFIRRAVGEIRRELNPPEDENRPRTRDEITEQEWAEYEWADVTSMGDRQRKYIRGLKR